MQVKFIQKILLISVLLATLFLGSCKDDYMYDDGKRPDSLHSSIYDYLKEDGNFKYYLRLIDDLNYTEVLSKTGSKTLFPVRDDAFQRFFDSLNAYGVTSYEELSWAQKRSIFDAGMIDMAYLTHMLPNVVGNNSVGEGLALRHNSSNTFLDSISFVRDEVLFANPYWSRFSGKGLYLVDNENATSIVHFTPENMTTRGITAEDFSTIYNGASYVTDGIYINGIRIIEKNISCLNGYIHIMEDLILPPKNMAQLIRDNGQTELFNKLMNKFSMPVPGNLVELSSGNQTVSSAVYNYYNGISPDRPQITDSVFVKRYFNESTYSSDYNDNPLSNYGLLYYDPTDNGYPSGSIEQDMGVMFVPTDQAMEDYLNSSKGSYLRDIYGSWDNVPTYLLSLFLKNHQKKSFLTSLPHYWGEMNDESSFFMGVTKSDIIKSYQANNGIVYVTNKVYPPIDYQCVYGPVLTSTLAKITSRAIQDVQMKFYLYLRSMENMYNLIVPVDDAFQNYKDPITWAQGTNNRQIWSFYYVPERDIVYADVYSATESGGKGSYIKTLGAADTKSSNDMNNEEYKASEQYQINNRLRDILDTHIVVGQMTGNVMSGYLNDGRTPYELTKGGSTIKATGTGDAVLMTGGGDIEQNVAPAQIIKSSSVSGIYDSDNGRTYFIDRILQDPFKSVYTVMGEHSEYKRFFDLLKGNANVFAYFTAAKDNDIQAIFTSKVTSSSTGIGMVVNSFNNYRYTIFIPTEDALNTAFAEDPNLYTWEEIEAEEDYDTKKTWTLYLLGFLKNHFMDNSVYINGNSFSDMLYETAAPDPNGKFYKLKVSSSGSDLVVKNETETVVANVLTTDTGLYNLMSRDYIVDNSTVSNAKNIVSSSRAVIHLINKALMVE